MAKTWVLDTETKGTGANMVPLDDVLAKPGAKRKRRRFKKPPRREAPDTTAAPGPRPPKKFKVMDVMTGQVVAEDAGTRETVDVLKRFRSVVDVDILVWDRPFERWRRLDMREKRKLWEFRDRA
jgi:hypothetical protein